MDADVTLGLNAPAVIDCEAPDSWSFAQDANAWSSLAYGVVGRRDRWRRATARLPPAFLALAAAITVEGVGSVLYHGDAGDIGQLPPRPPRRDPRFRRRLARRMAPARTKESGRRPAAQAVEPSASPGLLISTLATNPLSPSARPSSVAAALARRGGLPLWNGLLPA